MGAAAGPATRHAVTTARRGSPVPAKASPTGFGGVLRFWRTAFGLSQEELAGRAGVSPRHISFLENGRTTAGEGVASDLARALGLPPREAATLMLAAGHVPPLAGAPVGHADDATLMLLLRQTDPHPAAVLDALGNIRLVNKAWVLLHRRALGPLADTPDLNALRLLLHEQGWRRHLDDWEDIASMFLTALKQEALIHQDPEAGRLLRDMLAMPSVPEDWVRRGLAPSRLGYTVRVGTGAEARTVHIVHMMVGLFPFGGARPPIVQYAYPASGRPLLAGADLRRLPATRHALCPY